MAKGLRIEMNLTAEVKRKLGDRLASRVARCAQDVAANARAAIQEGPKTGKEYRRGDRVHQASAPGEAPATDYGVLANSIQADVSQAVSRKRASAFVGAEYGLDLELGTENMEPRPFFLPAAEAAFREMREGLERDLKDLT